MHSFLFLLAALFIFCTGVVAKAQEAATTEKPAEQPASDSKDCKLSDRMCLMTEIEGLIPSIDKQDWKDQTMRELAKSYTFEGRPEKALALIPKITNPDTKAMTIRGIGMTAAKDKWTKEQHADLFNKLTKEADKITHAPSRGIAYTYIAMSQAFAGYDDDARKTASGMENEALKHKAYGETAEIEAERGDLKNALVSLSAINSPSYRNKAYDTVSRIFLDKGKAEDAYTCAILIDNAYLKAKSIQRILNKNNPDELDMEPKADPAKEF